MEARYVKDVNSLLISLGGGQWASKFSSTSFHQRYDCGLGNDEILWTDKLLPYLSIALMLVAVVHASIGLADSGNTQDTDYSIAGDVPFDKRVEDIGGQRLIRDERNGLTYSYSLFHLMLVGATHFVMMSLTDWYVPNSTYILSQGKTWSAVWIKMAAAWMCLVMYLFITAFPSIVPSKLKDKLRMDRDTRMKDSGSISFQNDPYGRKQRGSARSVGRGYFGSNGSLGVAERIRRYSHQSDNSSLDAVPLTKSKKPTMIVCHTETTV